MTRVLAAVLVALMGFAALAADEASAPRDMVVLTAGGLLGKTNRGPLDPKRDSLLAQLKADFKNGFAFDRDMLLALPQGEVTAQPPEFDEPARFSGPLLREVLGYLEAAKVKTTFVAADGYRGYLLPEDIDGSDYILALAADGIPLGFGQQGPIWLLNTRADGAAPAEDGRGHWVWAVVYMQVGE